MLFFHEPELGCTMEERREAVVRYMLQRSGHGEKAIQVLIEREKENFGKGSIGPDSEPVRIADAFDFGFQFAQRELRETIQRVKALGVPQEKIEEALF